jgi:hypothetical protein
MIVLQEIDNSDSDQVMSDDQSIAAAVSVPAAAIMSQRSHVALGQTAPPLSAHDSGNNSDSDSAVSMSELAPSGSDFVDLPERTAPDDY